MKAFLNGIVLLIAFLGLGMLFLAFSYASLTNDISVGHSTKLTESNVRLSSFRESFQGILSKLNFPQTQIFALTDSNTVPILMYHYVRDVNKSKDPVGYNLSVSPTDFELQMRAFVRTGYNFITPRDFLEGKANNRSLMLTFDDGYADFYENAFPVLKRYRIKATVFVVSDFIDDAKGNYLTSAQIKELNDWGIEIGSHSVSHSNLTKASEGELARQLGQSKKVLEEIIGRQVISFAYPAGNYDDNVLRATGEAGYQLAVTVEGGFGSLRDNLLAQKRVRINGGENLERIFAKIDK